MAACMVLTMAMMTACVNKNKIYPPDPTSTPAPTQAVTATEAPVTPTAVPTPSIMEKIEGSWRTSGMYANGIEGSDIFGGKIDYDELAKRGILWTVVTFHEDGKAEYDIRKTVLQFTHNGSVMTGSDGEGGVTSIMFKLSDDDVLTLDFVEGGKMTLVRATEEELALYSELTEEYINGEIQAIMTDKPKYEEDAKALLDMVAGSMEGMHLTLDADIAYGEDYNVDFSMVYGDGSSHLRISTHIGEENLSAEAYTAPYSNGFVTYSSTDDLSVWNLLTSDYDKAFSLFQNLCSETAAACLKEYEVTEKENGYEVNGTMTSSARMVAGALGYNFPGEPEDDEITADFAIAIEDGRLVSYTILLNGVSSCSMTIEPTDETVSVPAEVIESAVSTAIDEMEDADGQEAQDEE